MITIIGRRNSVNVQKVMWAIGELHLSFERLDAGGSFGLPAGYKELNPNETIPTLIDGNLTLWESNACCRYLARTYGKGTLLPDDENQAALADQWMEWQTSTLSPAFFKIFLNRIRLPAAQADENVAEAGVRATGKLLERLESALTGRDFLVGDRLTMADLPLGAMMYRYFTMDIERPALPATKAWYARLKSQEAYTKHVMIPFGTNHDEWLVEEEKGRGLQ